MKNKSKKSRTCPVSRGASGRNIFQIFLEIFSDFLRNFFRISLNIFLDFL